MDISFAAVLHTLLRLQLVEDGEYLLAETVIALHQHSTEHIIRGSVKRKEILMVFVL